MTEEEKESAAKRLWHNIADTVYGMAAHDMSRAALRTRASMEHLFILITMGDLIGVPVVRPVYSLGMRLFVCAEVAACKLRKAPRKDFWEQEEYDLHGV